MNVLTGAPLASQDGAASGNRSAAGGTDYSPLYVETGDAPGLDVAHALRPKSARRDGGRASDLLANQEGATLEFVDCTYTVKVAKKGEEGKPCAAKQDRALLQRCSARVQPGEVLALMGPSGAGKTTLLNTLTLEKGGGTPTGVIAINGHPFTFAMYQQHACYVTQTDRLWAFLTAREHLEYATALYQPSELGVRSISTRGAYHTRLSARGSIGSAAAEAGVAGVAGGGGVIGGGGGSAAASSAACARRSRPTTVR